LAHLPCSFNAKSVSPKTVRRSPAGHPGGPAVLPQLRAQRCVLLFRTHGRWVQKHIDAPWSPMARVDSSTQRWREAAAGPRPRAWMNLQELPANRSLD